MRVPLIRAIWQRVIFLWRWWIYGQIHRLALAAPVSRIMVRQPQSKANAGAFNNGMPMTSSMGCGTWGGNITSENIHLKHYMNTTWVSKPIAEDRPTDAEVFGDFYDPECEK